MEPPVESSEENMENLTPKQAGSSRLALDITKMILRQPALEVVRKNMEDLDDGALSVFCGHLAREIDIELKKDQLKWKHSQLVNGSFQPVW